MKFIWKSKGPRIASQSCRTTLEDRSSHTYYKASDDVVLAQQYMTD